MQEVSWIESYQSLRGILYKYTTFAIMLDTGCGLALNRVMDHWGVSMTVLVSIHGMQPAGPMCASPALGTRDHCRIHMFFQKQLLPCVHPQTSGIACCLPSKPVVGDLAETQVHMGASFLPSWSCQLHILLSAAECPKTFWQPLEAVVQNPSIQLSCYPSHLNHGWRKNKVKSALWAQMHIS